MAEPFSEPTTNEEAQRLQAFLEKGAEVSLEVLERFPAAGEGTDASVRQPGSITFDVTAERLVETLAGDETQRILLDIDIGNIESSEGFDLRLFLGQKDATVDTPTRGEGFAAGIAFFCEPPADQPDPAMICPIDGDAVTRTTLDVTQSMMEAPGSAEPVVATFVVAPDSEQTPPDRSVTIHAAELSIVRSIVKLAS